MTDPRTTVCQLLLALLLVQVSPIHGEVLEELIDWHNIPPDVLQAAHLTSAQFELLSDVRWSNAVANLYNVTTSSGIPEGVSCKKKLWCDDLACTEICEKGTVELEDWLIRAIKSQVALSRDLPLCYVQWLGTHNSAITLADGYGNRDQYYAQLLHLTKWARNSVFRTHNQWFSLTDQLNMGVRLLELDVHWVKGKLRIAHCGGLSSLALNYLASLVNLVAVLTQSSFRWDSETFGCYPSASSIAAEDQRPLIDALEEVADWLHQPANHDEFLIILIDDQLDLAIWKLLPLLRRQLTKFIPRQHIFTPLDMARMGLRHLPSANTLLQHGKRVMFMSRQYYSDIGTRNFVFYTQEGKICQWTEPHLEDWDFDSCVIPADDIAPEKATMMGQICRIHFCEIEYGPLSCNLSLRHNTLALNSVMLQEAFACGVNFPSPDGLTPNRAKAAIWSWAPGHPYPQDHGRKGPSWEAVIHSSDGHWRSTDASFAVELPVVCRWNHSTVHFIWDIHHPPAATGSLCKDEYVPGAPRNGKENIQLQRLLLERGIPAARFIGLPSTVHFVQ